MVRTTEWLSRGIALGCTLLVLACASSNSSPAAAPSEAAAATPATLSIKILNDHAAAGTFVLFIEPVGGVRQSLGTVQAGTSPGFRFAAAKGNAYVLIQQTDAGDSRTSDRFTYSEPTSVTWDMSTMRIAVTHR